MLLITRSLLVITILVGMASTVEAQSLRSTSVGNVDVPGLTIAQHRLEIAAAYRAAIPRFLKLLPSFRKLRDGTLPVFVGEIIEPTNAIPDLPHFLDIYDFDGPTLRLLAMPGVEIVPQSKAVIGLVDTDQRRARWGWVFTQATARMMTEGTG